MILLSIPYTIPRSSFEGMITIHRLQNETFSLSHNHEFLELVYILSGEAEHYIGQSKKLLCAGDFFVIDYDTYHNYISEEGNLTIINCLFLPEMIDKTFAGIRSFNELSERYFMRITGRKISGPTSNQVFHDSGIIGEHFLKMLSEYERREDGYLEVMRCHLCQIIIETVRKVGSKTPLSPLTARIIQQINCRFAQPLTLQQLCREQHFSLSYTSARFHADTGLTFTDFLQNRRIEEACRMLTGTDLPVSQVAERVGYNSITFFNQTFRKVTKTTPREYRKTSRA